MELRDYQLEAVDSVGIAFKQGKKRVVLELATGSGKAVIVAEMCRRANKALVLCHTQEILKQNQLTLQRLAPMVKSSIFCAGLDQKDISGSVVFAHRDSFANLEKKPAFPFVVVDEAHTITMRPDDRYHRIFNEVDCKYLVGLTATPYRLEGGKVYGKDKPFEICAYKLPIGALVQRGYLTPYEFIESDPQVVAPEGCTGEVTDTMLRELGAQASQADVVRASAKLIQKHMKDRNCVIIFCCSRAHARAVADALEGCAYLDGETPQEERLELLGKMRAGHIKYVANVNVLSTGVDVPICDGVVMLRPTMSASLYVQAIGRALRLHPQKTKARILELTDNLVRFGDISDPMTYGTQKAAVSLGLSVGAENPTKPCKSCGMTVSVQTRVCPYCDYLFLRRREEYDSLDRVEISVSDYNIVAERSRKTGQPMQVVSFTTELGTIKEWLMIQSTIPWQKYQALAKLRKLRTEKVSRIIVKGLNEKYPRILTYHT